MPKKKPRPPSAKAKSNKKPTDEASSQDKPSPADNHADAPNNGNSGHNPNARNQKYRRIVIREGRKKDKAGKSESDGGSQADRESTESLKARQTGAEALIELSKMADTANPPHGPLIVDGNTRSATSLSPGSSLYPTPGSSRGSGDTVLQNFVSSHPAQPPLSTSSPVPVLEAQANLQTQLPVLGHGIEFGNYSDSSSTRSGTRRPSYQGPPHPYSMPFASQYPSQYNPPQSWMGPNQYQEYPDPGFRSTGPYYYYGQPTYSDHTFSSPAIPPYNPTIDYPTYETNKAPYDDENRDWAKEATLASDRPLSMSPKTESSHTLDNDLRVASSPEPTRRCFSTPTPPTGLDVHNYLSLDDPSSEELEPIDEFILNLFISGECSDYRLILGSPTAKFPPQVFNIHSQIASRSPHLKELMRCSGFVWYQNEIYATAANSFVEPDALHLALQNIYGARLLNQEMLDRDLSYYTDRETGEKMRFANVNRRQMDFVLSYIASASFLDESKILRRGVQLATNAINWDTLEVVLHFAIDVSNFTIVPGVNPSPGERSGSSTPFSDRCARESDRGWVNSHAGFGSINGQLKEVWVPQLLGKALDFITDNVRPGFELDLEAHSKDLPSRFWQDSSHPRPRADITTVGFGSLARIGDGQFTPEESTLSAIFFSVPYKILKKVFNVTKFKDTLTAQFVRDVVHEREKRRLRTLRFVNTKHECEMPVTKADAVGWREKVVDFGADPNDNAVIAREWVGLEELPEMVFTP
ncbi:hypothetical protein FQN50_004576 [Emmonsiellopsis sp. PD_5]|nr:hypothetical protein FQN50_004576 [Emmonsiellopsis sp. PD_5]